MYYFSTEGVILVSGVCGVKHHAVFGAAKEFHHRRWRAGSKALFTFILLYPLLI